MIKNPDDVLPLLAPLLSEKRLNHCKRVAEVAFALAEKHGLNADKAQWVGLTHDCAKYLNPETLKSYNVALSREEIQLYQTYPPIWHAFVGPKLCEALFGLKDPDMKAAIRWHTTGTSDMTPLTMVLYISDYIEPARTFPELPFIRSLAETQLEEATFAVSICVLRSLIKRGLQIHPNSVECYNWYQRLLPQGRIRDIMTALDGTVALEKKI